MVMFDTNAMLVLVRFRNPIRNLAGGGGGVHFDVWHFDIMQRYKYKPLRA